MQSCRQPNCEFRQLCFPEEDSYMICNECGGRTCISCDTVWHPDVSCNTNRERHAAELAVRAAEEAQAQRYLRKHSQTCPNCHSRTIKNGGCDHMTCMGSTSWTLNPSLKNTIRQVPFAAMNTAGSASPIIIGSDDEVTPIIGLRAGTTPTTSNERYHVSAAPIVAGCGMDYAIHSACDHPFSGRLCILDEPDRMDLWTT